MELLDLALAAIGSGVAVTVLTQLLKWELFKAPARLWPVPTAVVLTIVVSLAAVYGLGLVLDGMASYIVFAVVTLLVATQTYDLVSKAVAQVKGTN